MSTFSSKLFFLYVKLINIFYLDLISFILTFVVHSNFFFLFNLTFCRLSTRASVLRLDLPHYWADTNLNTLLATLSEQDCKLKKQPWGIS